MKLSLKAVRFVIEALGHYPHDLGQQLKQEGLSEGEISDLANRCQHLEAIKQDLKKYRVELTQQLAR